MLDFHLLSWMYVRFLLFSNSVLHMKKKKKEPLFIPTASANIQQHSKHQHWRLIFPALPITTSGTPLENMAPLFATRAYHQILLWAKVTYRRYTQVWRQDRATLCHSEWMPGIEQATTRQPRIKTWSIEFLPGPYPLQVERRLYREGRRDSKTRDFLLQS